MNITPFGQNVLLWRKSRGLTQAELARRVRLPQPNLSNIERGAQEVSLRTLRSLAAALEVRPGLLVDGVAPSAADQAPAPLTRQTLERIADAAAFNRRVADPKEQAAVRALQMLLRNRTSAARRQWSRPHRDRRAVTAAWGHLRGLYGRSAIQVLADRVLERQRVHASQSD